jgi:KUP system potassium uptake protein
MIPTWCAWPVIFLALLATIIASQAVISGAFSLTQQAIQLGLHAAHADQAHQRGGSRADLYPGAQLGADDHGDRAGAVLPVVEQPAAAYGIAVTGAMFIDTMLLAVVLISLWRWPLWKAAAAAGAVYRGRHGLPWREPDQGSRWRLGAAGDGLAIFTLLTTWSRGRALMRQNDGRRHDPDGGLRQERPFQRGARARHGNLHGSTNRACHRRCSTTSSTTRCCMNGW